MNSACRRCGSSQVHLAMISTPSKLVGRHVYFSVHSIFSQTCFLFCFPSPFMVGFFDRSLMLFLLHSYTNAYPLTRVVNCLGWMESIIKCTVVGWPAQNYSFQKPLPTNFTELFKIFDCAWSLTIGIPLTRDVYSRSAQLLISVFLNLYKYINFESYT